MHEIFTTINNWFEQWGLMGLAINSCVESFFLLPPPDILLITMDLKNPNSALWYAFVCTIASAIGGAIGYGIGRFGGRPVFNFLFKKQQEKFQNVENLYNKYGVLAVFFSAFTPIPYKIFTITSGILKMNFWQFFLTSFVGRGARFFLVSIVLTLFGESIKKHLELIIFIVTIIIIIFFILLYKYRKIFEHKP